MRSHPGVKPAVWGAVIGAAGMAIVGFSALGWTLGTSAERMAKDQAEAAVVDALTPVCVARFEAQADAGAKLADFKKITTSWDQRSFVEKGRLGDDSWKRFAEFGRSPCMRGEARQNNVTLIVTRPG